MSGPSEKDILDLTASGYFDADWYRDQYPDVARSGIDPARHYLIYGFRLNRDPGPDFSTRFVRTAFNLYEDREPIRRLAEKRRKAKGEVFPDPKRVLMAANEVARFGDHARAITLAETYLPADLAHTIAILRANEAVARGDIDGWAAHLNTYLAHYKTAPIQLEGEGSVFDRLACAPLAPVTGGPLVSVIMPAWNAEATVRKAAQSILNQTWRNLELLIVDDASSDGTWAILQEIAQRDSRVRIARNKANVGPYVSKNIALGEAKGEWITGHDADDWAHSQRLETHMQHILVANGRIVASQSYLLRMRDNGLFSGISRISPEKIDGVLLLSAISAIFNAAFFRQRLGAYDCARFGADKELAARTQIATGQEIDRVVNVSMLCLELDGSLTNNETFGASLRYPQTPGRMEYKSAWQGAHVRYTVADLPPYRFPPGDPPFEKPDLARVDDRDIRQVAESTEFGVGTG